MTRPARVHQAEYDRLFASAARHGHRVKRVVVERDGRMVVDFHVPGRQPVALEDREWGDG